MPRIMQQAQDFLNIKFALRYGIWGLLGHEKIPETHVMATLLTGNAPLFNRLKDLFHIR